MSVARGTACLRSLAAILVLLTIWGVGLLTFAGRVGSLETPPDVPVADGIVSLTGSSVERLRAGARLLDAGKGRRLLVSGVNRDATRAEVQRVAGGYERLWRCCVDLGFEAETTLGNAQETAAWARRYRFRRLIVVTADYHMPRSLLELRAALPGVTLTPYPVASEDLSADRWWRDGASARRMVLEYCKYLAVLGREAFLSLGPRDAAPAAGRTPARS